MFDTEEVEDYPVREKIMRKKPKYNYNEFNLLKEKEHKNKKNISRETIRGLKEELDE